MIEIQTNDNVSVDYFCYCKHCSYDISWVVLHLHLFI